MRLEKGEINGIKFAARVGTSDIKTFEEVIGRDVYEKRGNKINASEHWQDLGGNVGAFTLLACSKGATVDVYEPCPFNCEMIERNLKLNGFSAKLTQAALTHNDTKEAVLYAGNNGDFWRNSLLKNWNGKGIKVPCVNFDETLDPGACVKMDIEGFEMPILETTKLVFPKMVFEWSFDIDPSLERFWRVLDKLKSSYEIKCNERRGTGVTVWGKNWFPACENVFCYAKS